MAENDSLYFFVTVERVLFYKSGFVSVVDVDKTQATGFISMCRLFIIITYPIPIEKKAAGFINYIVQNVLCIL